MSDAERRRFAFFARSWRTGLGLVLLAGLGLAAALALGWARRPDRVAALTATLPLGWAAVVGMGAVSPLGDAERASAYPLPRLRLAHLVGLLMVGGRRCSRQPRSSAGAMPA